MPYVIAEPCIHVKDKACVEVCPVDCIYEGPEQLFIHPDECIDCGACEPVCPVTAIFAEDETPEPWKPFIDLNKQFFVENPGVEVQQDLSGCRGRSCTSTGESRSGASTSRAARRCSAVSTRS